MISLTTRTTEDFLDAQASLAPTQVSPCVFSFVTFFRISILSALRWYRGGRHGGWNGGRHGSGQGDQQGGRHGADMADDKKMADRELDMVADMKVDKVVDMVDDKKK